MEMLERVFSDSGTQIIEIVRTEDGTYLLQKYVRKYDTEEETFYEIREYPDPSGRFGDLEIALKEAKNILGISK